MLVLLFLNNLGKCNMKKIRYIFASVLMLFVFNLSAFAQNFREQSETFPDLTFPTTPVDYSDTTDMSNKLFKPKLELQKYPVLVVLHSCSGLKSKSEEQLRKWVKGGLDNGYMVFVIDSLRGAHRNCRPRPVPEGRLLKDATDLADHLSTLKFVDANRLYTVGFSLGGMVGGLLASPGIMQSVAPTSKRYRATVSLYGGCDYGRGGKFLYNDTDKPVLWLMGSDDTESPPSDCIWVLDNLKDTNVNVVHHTYKGATHCWDCKDLDGFSKTSNNGRYTVYKYNAEYADDSKKRVFEFLSKHK
jgi:dienelactone hydrolase